MAEPAQLVDIALDTTTNDLVLLASDLTTVSGTALVAQRLKIILQLFKGEWFLDADAGIPWFQEILEKGVDPTVVDAILRKAILGTTDVNRILTYTSSIDAAARSISIAFSVDTVYGPVSWEGTLI